jgi:hypothetical protein
MSKIGVITKNVPIRRTYRRVLAREANLSKVRRHRQKRVLILHTIRLRMFCNRRPGLRLIGEVERRCWPSIWEEKDIYVCVLVLVYHLTTWGLPS